MTGGDIGEEACRCLTVIPSSELGVDKIGPISCGSSFFMLIKGSFGLPFGEDVLRRIASLLLSSSVRTQDVFIPTALHFSNLQNWHLFLVSLLILQFRSLEHSSIGRLLLTVRLKKALQL